MIAITYRLLHAVFGYMRYKYVEWERVYSYPNLNCTLGEIQNLLLLLLLVFTFPCVLTPSIFSSLT